MTVETAITDEQIKSIYMDFASNAVAEYNANGRFKPAMFLVARRLDGYEIAEMPEAYVDLLLSRESDRMEFVVRAMLTEGSQARAAVLPKPDVVVVITEAFDMPVPRNDDGSPRAPTPQEIAQASTDANAILAVQLFTSAGAWAGASKIEGTPKQATLSPEVRNVAAFVTMPISAPTIH